MKFLLRIPPGFSGQAGGGQQGLVGQVGLQGPHQGQGRGVLGQVQGRLQVVTPNAYDAVNV